MVEVSIIIPTYRERGNIAKCLSNVGDTTAVDDRSFEVIVVDDDSPDGTASIARTTGADLDLDVRVVIRQGRSDLSRSIVRGFREARGDVMVVLDADLQHPPAKVPELVDEVSPQTPVVVGTRYGSSGGIEDWSRLRRLVSAGALGISKLLIPPARDTTDPISGFFAVSADALSTGRLEPSGYKILLGLLSAIDPDDVAEVGYVFRDRHQGRSSLGFEQYVKFLRHSIGCGIRYRLEGVSGYWRNLPRPTGAYRSMTNE